MAGTNQIFTIVAFALLVVLVLGLGLLVAILVQRRRTKKAKAASELRKAERRRAAQAGVAGLHEDTETSGGISMLGLSVQRPEPDAAPSRLDSSPLPWAAAPRQDARSAAWLPASVQQASGQAPPVPQRLAESDSDPQAEVRWAPMYPAPRRVPERTEPASPAGEPGSGPAPHSYGPSFSGGGSSKR